MEQHILMVYTTHPDEQTAQHIARQLLEKRLIACANVFPISSAYWWMGAIEQGGEWIALFKAKPELEADIEAAIQELHPYEVPCIIRWTVRANAAYAQAMTNY